MDNSNTDIDLIDNAIDPLLLLRLRLGGIPNNIPIPHDAIDQAIGADPDCRAARDVFRAALQEAQDAVVGVEGGRQVVLGIEASSNALAVAAADAGFRLGAALAGTSDGGG